MKNIVVIFLVLVFSCIEAKGKEPNIEAKSLDTILSPTLNLKQANRLAELPLNCVGTEYPNKLGQTLGSDVDLKSPQELHPAFYGCFDWHSAVHGHWSIVSLLRQFPDLEKKTEMQHWLLKSISKDNILKEVEYFQGNHSKSYERTYGWAWLLKLAEEF